MNTQTRVDNMEEEVVILSSGESSPIQDDESDIENSLEEFEEVDLLEEQEVNNVLSINNVISGDYRTEEVIVSQILTESNVSPGVSLSRDVETGMKRRHELIDEEVTDDIFFKTKIMRQDREEDQEEEEDREEEEGGDEKEEEKRQEVYERGNEELDERGDEEVDERGDKEEKERGDEEEEERRDEEEEEGGDEEEEEEENGRIKHDSQTQRIHNLEQERRDLLNKLIQLKETLIYTEHSLTQTTTSFSQLQDTHTRELTLLRKDLTQAQSQIKALQIENSQLNSSLEVVQTTHHIETNSLDHMKDSYKEIIDSLKKRVNELGGVELQLIKANRRIKQLEKEVIEDDEERRVLAISRKQVNEYDELVQRNLLLQQENKILRQRIDNAELLTYQLQSIREKNEQLEKQQNEFDKLKLENQELKEKLIELTGIDDAKISELSSPAVLRCRILQLQQKEVILINKCGELETSGRLAQQTINEYKEELSNIIKQLAGEKEECRSKNEAIQRLERRLQFITKEREGCVNVLNSYKLDIGADSVMKEMITELQESISRLTVRVSQLETEVDDCCKQLSEEKKRVVEFEEEARVWKEKLLVLEESNHSLKKEKQNIEELLLSLQVTQEIKSETVL